MAETKDGGPAFPGGFVSEDKGFDYTHGMSLRDYFAAQAMCGIALWQRSQGGPFFNAEDAEITGILAYQLADAMLKAREAK